MEDIKPKKKRNLPVAFPQIFTVEELNTSYPDMVEITLRYKIGTAIERGQLIQIGKISKPVGRPQVVYGKVPISNTIIKSARDRGVYIFEEVNNKVKDITD